MKLNQINNLISSLFFAIVCFSCNKEKKFADLSSAISIKYGNEFYESSLGETYNKRTVNNELILFQSDRKENIVTKIIVVAFEKKMPEAFNNSEPNIAKIHLYKDKRAFLLHTQNTNRIYLIGLEGDVSTNKYKSLKNESNFSNKIELPILGYGLSIMIGKWDLSELLKRTENSAFDQIEKSKVAQVSNSYDSQLPLSIDPEHDGTNCTSGGTGASSCEITEAPFGQSCNVTCNPGYYACCNSQTVRCNCIKYPPPPK